MTITTKENASGRISGYYVDGAKVRKSEIDGIICNRRNEIIYVDYYVGQEFKMLTRSAYQLKVVFTGYSEMIMTQAAADELGYRVIRNWRGIYRNACLVEENAPEQTTAEENVEEMVEEVAAEEKIEVVEAADNNVDTEETSAKFEAGKTYYVSGAVSAIKITMTKRTVKTIVVESDDEIYVRNTRYKVNDSEHGEFIKLGFHSGAKWIYAKNEYTADVQAIDEQNQKAFHEWAAQAQAAYDKAWEEHQAELKAKREAEERADETAIEAARKNIVEKLNTELETDPNAEHPTMARYLTTVAYKPEWQETMWPVNIISIRSTDFARAEKALDIIKTSLTGLPIEFDEEPCIKVFDKWENEFVPVYYVEETDGSEDDMDDEEIFDVTPADENDAEDELIDEAAEIVANVENTVSEINFELLLTSVDTPKIKADRNAKFKAGIKNQTIGVEIEFTGITRKAAAEAIAAHFGTSAYYVGGEYDTWEIKDKRRRTWKVMFDSSLISQSRNDNGRKVGANDYYRCELVTPILRWNDIATLQGVVGAIVAAGGFVNKSCGLHVHIGGNGFTAQALRNLVNIVGSRENLFYEAFAVDNYRKDFCRPTDERIIRELNENKPSTLDEFKEIWYNGRTRRADYRYDDSRYTIANLHSFFSKGTVEFRPFNSTLDAEEIAAAIHFSAALADMAKRKSRTTYEVLTDRPFERMIHFLGRLKLTGDEFKTTRYHILKHLASGKTRKTAVA